MTSLVDGFVAHLSDPSMDIRSKLNVATEMRDSVEINQVTADQDHFVSQLLPEITRLLESVPISMIAASPEHKLRHLLLDVLARLQPSEALKPSAKNIMDIVMKIVKTDNEENGVLCMKILTNLHRAFKTELGDYVQPFLDLVVQIIGNMPKMVHDLFDTQAVDGDESNANSGTSTSNPANIVSANANTSNSANTNNNSSNNAGNNGNSSSTSGSNPNNFNNTNNETEASPNPTTTSPNPSGATPLNMHDAGASATSSANVTGTPSGQTPIQGASAGPTGAPGNAHQTQLFPAMHSFKVLTECPIIIVLLFTSHRQMTSRSLPALVPHAIEILSLEAAPQAKEHAAAASRGTFFAGVAPTLRRGPHRASYSDFVTAQIKMMSFVAFIVRAFSPVIQRHLPMVPNFVIRLLKDCPPENSAARKELLVSMRHITNTDHRAFFLNKIHILLEERVLIGSGLTAYETLRPLAFSTVADLIHHLRNELSMTQIWQAVNVYTKNLLDMRFAPHYQGMSLKLLLNVLDRLSSMQKPQEGRQIVLIVLKAVLERLALVNRQSLDVEKATSRTAKIIKMHQEMPNVERKDAKFVFRSLITFLRSLMFSLKASNPMPSQRINVAQWQEAARVFDSSGVQLFRWLLHETTRGLKLYTDDDEITLAKENMDAIVAVYMQLDPATFNEVFELEIESLIAWALENPEHLHMTYLLSGNEATTTGFCTILLKHLMERLPEVGEPKNGVLLLRLFKQCFSAINMFPTVNEPVILPHLNDLIVKSLNLANDATEPRRYYSLLQHLFRTLGGGRFDSVYKLVLPLLYYLLETLNRRLEVARLPEEKNIYADLCLTVPVRLSLMVPHLNFLMRPLATALNAVDTNLELVAQGLRTLELCVDNLTAVYFDPHIEPVLPEVLPALWRLLRPLPFDHKLSHTTLRILGKLGGRSRAHIKPPNDLKSITVLDQDVKALLTMDIGDVVVPVRVTPAISVALRVLETPSAFDKEYHVQAYKLIRAVLMKLIPNDREDLTISVVQLNVQVNGANVTEDGAPMRDFPDAPIDKEQRKLSSELAEQLIRGIFLTCQCDELRDEARELLRNIAEHVVLLELGEFNIERRRALRPFNVNEYEGDIYVPPRSFVSATVLALSHQNEEVSVAGEHAIRFIANAGKEICGEEIESYRHPLFRGVFAKLSHTCFEEPWYIKQGAIKGLDIVIREIGVPKPWLGARAIELTRTLFFVIKDSSPVGGYGSGNVPTIVSRKAADLLMFMLTQVELRPNERSFATLVGLLAFELESACRYSREVAQRALKYIADSIGKKLSEVLEKVTEVFLTPIFMKPLRALPFPMQIGYSDCVSFCFSLPDTFLKFNDKLTRLLEEALALVDADDESLTSGQRLCEYTTAQQLTELRVVCIRLLARAATTSDYLATKYPALRTRIIAVFFKIMVSGNQRAVDAAYDGMKMILKVSQKLPKDLLQAGLKPILLPLSEFKRLNVNVLNCLTRMLELLTYNFKVEIGVKLLDHLRTLADPSRLINLSTRVLDGDERIELGVAFINVFHMLPPAAHVFIRQLVPIVVEMESVLRRKQYSPFRKPIAKFLNRYPAESFEYFAERLTNPTFGRFFADMIARAPRLAQYSQEHLESLCGRIMTQPSEEDQCYGICNLIQVICTIKAPRKVLFNLVSSIGDVVRAAGNQPQTSSLHLAVPMAINDLQLIIIKDFEESLQNEEATAGLNAETTKTEVNDDSSASAIEKSSGDVKADEASDHDGVKKLKKDTSSNEHDNQSQITEKSSEAKDGESVSNEKESTEKLSREQIWEQNAELLESLVYALCDVDVPIVPQLKDYLWSETINTTDMQPKKFWLMRSLQNAVDVSAHPRVKETFMTLINTILLVHAETHEDSLVDLVEETGWLQRVNELVWQRADELMPAECTPGNPWGSGLGTSTLDYYFIQLLQMSVLLVKHAPSKIVDMRKSVIKFGWRYITVEDSVSKLSAYVLVCYFVAAFDTLPKIVVQIYMALLKTSQVETRTLVQQALDALATVIVQRINSPMWARAPRRILSEDGHGILGVTNVCLFLSRHAKLFYPYRELYVPFVVSALARLSYMNSQSLDVELAELLASWESERYKDIQPKNEASEGEGDKNADSDVKMTDDNEAAGKAEVSINSPASGTSINKKNEPMSSYEVPHSMREAVVIYLVRFITTQPHKTRDQTASQRVLKSLDKLLSLWPDVEVRLNFFDRTLAQSDLGASAPILNASLDALHMVDLALKHKNEEQISLQIEEISQLLTKPLQSPLLQIHETLTPILERLLACDQGDVILRQVVNACGEHLAPQPPAPPHNVWVKLASVAMKKKPACMDEHMGQAIKGLSRMAKELLELTASSSSGNAVKASIAAAGTPGATNAATAGAVQNKVAASNGTASAKPANSSAGNEASPSAGASTAAGANASVASAPGVTAIASSSPATDSGMLVEALLLVASRISHLGDQRRPFLSFIAHVIERIHDKAVSHSILNMVRSWVFGSEPFPTIKEKSAILYKLLLYTDRDLVEKYFQIIIDVFESPRLRNTELPTRLEQPFLVGCTSPIISVRTRLLQILTDSVERSVAQRMQYVIADQSWESIADKQWLCQALQLVLGPVKQNEPLQLESYLGFSPISILTYAQRTANSVDGEDEMEVDPARTVVDFVARRHEFIHQLNSVTAQDFVTSITTLMFLDKELVHQTWIDVFPAVYRGAFAEKDRHELIKHLVGLMAKEYNLKQADERPNVVQTMLAGVAASDEQVPPQLAKYLSTNYDTWYTAIQICENIMEDPQSNSPKVAEVNLDSLAELYAALGEDDHFYGLWRTRSKFPITSAALSYEQCGMWNRAMQLHETAQVRARSGVIPFGESEYALWEDHWIYCAEKLQHWEILTDIAKHEGFTDLLLECQWRLADWMADRDALASTIKTVMDVPTPRRQVFETFLSLQGFAQKSDTLQHLSQTCDEGIQLALRKWHSLPDRFTQAHAPLLHIFQQYVEFMEATQVYTSLQATTALNLEGKSQELKGVMQAWHDRLPNVWDDINWWGDLAAWRQHVFGVINRVYLPLIPQLQTAQGASGNGQTPNSSAAYRGYHEIAWTINRFAHTARKQNMPDVCITQLSKIYTLPNIEIQEAFLKLREQAKCHLQNPNELATGLDVISNTNLAFFGNPQKAEFFALKGESLAKLGQYEHAYNVLSAAVQVDLHLPKAWAAWGEFSDRRFKDHPEDFAAGSSAITCYLHAISLYKNGKSRKLIGRLLWLIGLEDPSGALAEAYEDFKGETPTWYYVTYIPQLLTSLSQREGKFTARILTKIAKAFPQALHFHLRTAREEYALMQRVLQRQEMARNAAKGAATAGNNNSNSPRPQAASLATKPSEESRGSDKKQADATGKSESDGSTRDKAQSSAASTNKANAAGDGSGTANTPNPSDKAGSDSGTPNAMAVAAGAPRSSVSSASGNAGKGEQKSALEYTEDIMSVLKTAYPLLALSLETLIDQMNQRFKSSPDEDVYRLVIALLNDGLSIYGRQQNIRENQRLPPQTEASVARFAEGVVPEHTRAQFKADFVTSKPNMDEYIHQLRKWRNRLEAKLDVRPLRMNLEAVSPPLGEFHYQKFEDVEVPGQNMELVDDNRFFTKIARFVPHVEYVRGYSACHRRITIQATDGSLHPFAVQYPSPRNCRREERVSQVFKILNGVMQRRTEARRRNLTFTLPNAIPLNMQIRMVQDDPHYLSLYQIYERFCRQRGQSRDLPFDYTIEQLRAAIDPQLPKPELQSVKVEILAGVQAKYVPQTILRDFFLAQYRSYEEFWLFRKQFAYQYAGVSFMTVMMSINSRYPQKFMVNMNSGNIWATDMQPMVMQTTQPPTYLNGEPVAFRLTPNLQTLMGNPVIEGVFAPTMMIIAKGLIEPEFDLQQLLPLFVRDELVSWFGHQLNPNQKFPLGITSEQGMQNVIKMNVEAISRRAVSLGQPGHSNSAANQTALDLISLAVNPRSLAMTDILWMPYY